MKVLKFGGTSVGTPQSLANVCAIVESLTEPSVVTVSALGGITDRLIAAADAAAAGNASYSEIYEEIRIRHRNVCEAVVPTGYLGAAWQAVDALLNELGTILKAINLLGEITERTRDLVVSYGERMSCIIVTAMIPGAVLAHSLEFIRTRRSFGKSVLDQTATSALIAEKFSALKAAKVVVVPGFIARDKDGRISNLGRGGSDYTAAILAAELNADILEIWTDVDGFMTADPRIVKSARVIDRLSFVEAMELCNFGAKVVYPPTIYPVFHKNIPIVIKNTFNPAAPGTVIGDTCASAICGKALGVSSLADTRLVRLPDSALYSRMINLLTKNGIETMLADGNCSCGIKGGDALKAAELLREEFASELNSSGSDIAVSDRLSTIALIGRSGSDNESNDLAANMAKTLNAAGIPIAQAPQLVSDGSVACMVSASDLNDALITIHENFIH
ncbi:MAG: aspartate kinase [Bacteroides sp.]|nr:aspartate kinase [Bacteroides sp.]MCM1378614.1 aspartate kinase [Bacteroides sp.]MCM1444915.1 aspartate kinase [Prevotella sp.]